MNTKENIPSRLLQGLLGNIQNRNHKRRDAICNKASTQRLHKSISERVSKQKKKHNDLTENVTQIKRTNAVSKMW
jgi:hypothetical protein